MFAALAIRANTGMNAFNAGTTASPSSSSRSSSKRRRISEAILCKTFVDLSMYILQIETFTISSCRQG